MSEADDFRKQAEEARQMAGRAGRPMDKAFWLHLAEDLIKLAQDADAKESRQGGENSN